MVMRVGTALCAALLLTGCTTPYSPVPVATHFNSTEQARLQAAAHWRAISAHIERQLSPALRSSPRLPLYVQPLQGTPFNRAVASQMITSLVNDGYVVSKSPDAPLKVEIDTQVVEFSADRPQYKFSGERSALVAGAWAITSVDHSTLGLVSAAIAAQDAYAWFRSQFSPEATPQTEIIVTVSVSDEARYYARYTTVYYTTDSDRLLYDVAPVPRPQPSKSFAVTGG